MTEKQPPLSDDYVEGRADWIRQHGSERLRKLFRIGYGVEDAFHDEWLAREFPAWWWRRNAVGHPDRAFAHAEGLSVLGEARRELPDARLVYWRVPHALRRDNNWRKAGYTVEALAGVPKHEWSGYLAMAELLGEDCLFGLPERYKTRPGQAQKRA